MSVPFTFANQSGIIPLNQLDANFAALDSKVPDLAISAGTVISGDQPNITSVGILNSLTVTSGVTAGSLTGITINGVLQTGAQPNITEIGALANLTVTDTLTTGTVSATSLTGALTTAAQPNITSVGTLSSLTVSGNVSATNLSGTLTTAAQPNITSLGTLTSLAVSGAMVGTLTTAAQPNITSVGTLTSLSVSGNIAGTLSTAAQPNVTSVGTLTSLSVSGTSTLSGVATAPTAANGTNTTQIATTAFVQNSLNNFTAIPSGLIAMWSGSVGAVPSGWFLCNGSNGTPDLRDRFIIGAGISYGVGATGGSANAIVVSHTHTATSVVTDPGHAHSYNAPSGFDDGGFSGSVVDNIISATTGTAATGITVATTIASAGSSGTNANLPPYYALAYIMKA